MTTRTALIGDGATNGTTVARSNSGRKAGIPVDAMSIGSGASVTYDTSLAYHGSASVRITTGGSAVNSYAMHERMYRPANGAAQVLTLWIYQASAFSATCSMVMIANATTQRMLEIRLTGTGKIRLINAAGTQTQETSASISLNTWVRVDVLFTPHASAGVTQIKLYNNPASSTPTETTTQLTGQNLRQTQVERVFLGVVNGAVNSNIRYHMLIGDGTPPPFGSVGWVMYRWVGAVTDTGATVAARTLAADSVRLVCSTTSDLATSPIYSSAQVPDSDGTVRMSVTGLNPDTLYYYGIECDGVVDPDYKGDFTTAPTPGTQKSFVFTAASCAQNGSNADTFSAIVAANPAFMIHLGDLHYRDITTNSQTDLHIALDEAFSGPLQSAMFGTVPTGYIWSDHDSVGPNGDASSAANPAANAVYRSRVPHYSIPATTGTYFSFIWGRVKFVCTDGRSFMDPIADPDNSSKTKLGATQLAWLIDELTDPAYPVKVWCHEDAISNGGTFTGDDTWSAYSTERATIMAAISGENVAYICGDLHVLAADDGTNVPSTGANSGMPVFVCAPLDNLSFTGNGTYSEGEYPTSDNSAVRQYGWFEVTDAGGSITLDYEGRSSDGTVRVSYTHQWLLSTTHDGAANLTASGTLTAVGVSVTSGAAALTATGGLTAIGSQRTSAAAALTAQSAMTASGNQVATGAANLTSTGTLTSVPVVTTTAQADLSGQSSLTASGIGVVQGSAALSASGSMSATGQQVASASAALSAATDLTAQTRVTTSAQAVLTATSDLLVNVEQGVVLGQADLSTSATMTASGTRVVPGSAALSAESDQDVIGLVQVRGAAALSGQSSLTATGTVVASGAAVLTAQSTMTAEGTTQSSEGASLSATSSMTVTATVRTSASAALSATGGLSAVGSGVTSGAASLTATGALNASGVGVTPGAAVLTAQSGLTVLPTLFMGRISFSATSDLDATGYQVIAASAGLAASGTMVTLATTYVPITYITGTISGLIRPEGTSSGDAGPSATARSEIR